MVATGKGWDGKTITWRGKLARSDGKITVGICARDKKAQSKHMRSILSRFDTSKFEFVFFGDQCILHRPVEEWPICDVLVAFFSVGFPIDKAEAYVALRQPYSINNLAMQRDIQDRRRVYAILQAAGVSVPKHVCVSRDGAPGQDTEVDEGDDSITVGGVTINKPFVEKPVDAEDHNIYIYYPMSAGGGSKRLFRKVRDRSSEFYGNVSEVRRTGSYIYEEFVETQGTDVKVYTVGPNYGHAEARKSPTLDGKVNRDQEGKEIRYPVILSSEEKAIASRVTQAFGQAVCGFDILRVQGRSFVCDVNGWSFVKNSRKYHEDCALLLMEFCEAAVKPSRRGKVFSTLAPMLKYTSTPTPTPPTSHHHRRTSAGTSSRRSSSDATDLAANAASGVLPPHALVPGASPLGSLSPDSRRGSPAEGQHVLASRDGSLSLSYSNGAHAPGSSHAGASRAKHPEELRCVIAIMRHGDRTPKQKMKMHVTCSHYLNYFARHAANPRKDLKVKGKMELKEFLKVTVDLLEGGSLYSAEGDPVFDQDIMTKYLQIRHVLERWEISGINRKLQLKPHAWVTPEGATTERATELELILKWGGELTKLGERQAMELGDNFRRAIYPDVGGGGLLRLHSTFRHDLKIKTSDEGRVMKTAAAFAKGFLELEGGLTPILVSLVHKEKSSGMMLDQTGNKDIKKDMDRCKAFIKKVLDTDVDMSEEAIRAVVPASQESVMGALRKLRNPQARLREVMGFMEDIVKQLEDRVAQCGASPMARDGRVSREERDYDRGQAEMKFSTRRVRDEGQFSLSPSKHKELPQDAYQRDPNKPARGETLLLMVDRWRTLRRELYNERKGGFDITKVPDVHDNARYDCLHNWSLKLEGLDKLYDLAKDLADCVVPQEYGITVPEKQTIGSKMCNALLEKIRMDLIIARGTNEDDSDMRYNLDLSHAEDLPINSLGRRVRTRLYFTSESHLQTLLNVLRYPIGNRSSVVTEEAARMISRTKELCYLTSFVLRLFEDLEKPPTDPTRFRVEILFSPGVVKHPLLPDDHLHTAPLVPLHKNLSCAHLEGSLEAAMTLAATPHVDEAAHEREEELLRAQLAAQMMMEAVPQEESPGGDGDGDEDDGASAPLSEGGAWDVHGGAAVVAAAATAAATSAATAVAAAITPTVACVTAAAQGPEPVVRSAAGGGKPAVAAAVAAVAAVTGAAAAGAVAAATAEGAGANAGAKRNLIAHEENGRYKLFGVLPLPLALGLGMGAAVAGALLLRSARR